MAGGGGVCDGYKGGSAGNAGCIVLAAVEPVPELEEAMRRFEKLSARKQKQKQVREFIGVIAGKAARR